MLGGSRLIPGATLASGQPGREARDPGLPAAQGEGLIRPDLAIESKSVASRKSVELAKSSGAPFVS